jgi:hypothetical protein
MAKRRGAAAVLVMLALSLAGCPRKANDGAFGDGGGGGAGGTEGWASNAAEVARFSDEVPFGPDAVIARDKTPVRTAPGGGEVVTNLPAGTEVTKLAARGGEDLVCFDDPKPGGPHMAGWVAQSALQDSAPPPAPGPTPNAVDDGGTTPPSPTPHGGGHHHKHKPRRQ